MEITTGLETLKKQLKMKNIINKITLSGEVASGKSTVGKKIAERLEYEFISIGNKTREHVESRGMTIVEFQNKCIENPELDKEIDLTFSNDCNSLNKLVIDYRLGYHFIKDAFHVFLKISEENATDRLKKAQRKNETHLTIRERNDSFKQQFLSAYNIDYTDENNYDLVLGVTNYANPDEIVDAIIEGFKLKNTMKTL